jgi:hypothetical protein
MNTILRRAFITSLNDYCYSMAHKELRRREELFGSSEAEHSSKPLAMFRYVRQLKYELSRVS